MRCRRVGKVRTPASVSGVTHRGMKVAARLRSASFSNSLDVAVSTAPIDSPDSIVILIRN